MVENLTAGAGMHTTLDVKSLGRNIGIRLVRRSTPSDCYHRILQHLLVLTRISACQAVARVSQLESTAQALDPPRVQRQTIDYWSAPQSF